MPYGPQPDKLVKSIARVKCQHVHDKFRRSSQHAWVILVTFAMPIPREEKKDESHATSR
jgi:hypothetical protein